MLTKATRTISHSPLFKAEFKVFDNSDEFPSGAIEGYASVFGNTDLGGDVMQKGAFRKTLKKQLPLGRVKIYDSHMIHKGTEAIIGVVTSAKEDDHGLLIKGPLSSVQHAQDVRTKIKEKILDAMSFGYNVKDSEDGPKGTRLIKEVELYEVSVVPWGMNPEAVLTGVKGFVSTAELPLAPVDTLCGRKEALQRIQSEIGGDPVDWTEADQKEFAKAFLWSDSEGNQEFLVADIVDGKMSYVWNAVAEAMAVVVTATDGKWFGEKTAIEAQLCKLAERFGKSFESKSVVMPVELKAIMEEMGSMNTSMTFANLMRDLRSGIRR